MASEKVTVEISIEEREALRALSKLNRGVDDFADTTTKKVTRVDRAFASFAGNLAANAAGKAIGFLTNSLSEGFDSAISFQKGLTEINTILPKNTKLTQIQIKQLEELGKSYGTDATQQAKAYYQVISAGVTDATEANNLLNDANKLAVGGLSDTTSAINILTSATNSYGSENLNSTQASDSLFTAVRLGKTTVDELASSLGKAIPAAKAAGVTFDGLNAAVATLTTRGFDTAVAVTRVNALFTGLARNGKILGAGFDLTAVKTEGLAVVLARLEKRTGGGSGALLKLLGSTEAVQAAQTLGANGARDYASALEQFSSKAGSANSAFEEFKESSVDFKFKVLNANLDAVSRNFIERFIPALAEASDAVVAFLTDTAADSKFAEQGLDGLRKELSALRLEASSIEENAFNLPDFLLGDLDEAKAGVKLYEAKIAEVTSLEKNLVESRVANANALDAINDAVFGRSEFVTQGAAPAPAQAEFDVDASPRVVAEVKTNEKVLASRAQFEAQLALLEENKKIKEQETLLLDDELGGEQREAVLLKLQEFNDNKANIELNAALAKNKAITDVENQGLANSIARSNKEIAVEKNKVKTKAELDAQNLRDRAAFFGAARSLANSENDALAAIGKAAGLLQIAQATPPAIASSFKFGTATGGPILGAVFAGIAGAAQAAQLAQMQKFATGGVVGGFMGATNGGDNTTASVRTGEMILNSNQQKTLFDIADNKSSGNGIPQVIEVTSIVQIDEREVARSVRNQRLEGFE